MSAPTRHSRSKNATDDTMEAEPVVLAEPDPESADSLISVNDPDDLTNEQTWPTEEEMKGIDQGLEGTSLPDAKVGTTPKRVKRVPKGMSEYQAAWIVDSDEDDGGDDEDGEGDAVSMDTGGESEGEGKAQEEEEVAMDELMESESKKSVVTFQDLEMEEETRQ